MHFVNANAIYAFCFTFRFQFDTHVGETRINLHVQLIKKFQRQNSYPTIFMEWKHKGSSYNNEFCIRWVITVVSTPIWMEINNYSYGRKKYRNNVDRYNRVNGFFPLSFLLKTTLVAVAASYHFFMCMLQHGFSACKFLLKMCLPVAARELSVKGHKPPQQVRTSKNMLISCSLTFHSS